MNKLIDDCIKLGFGMMRLPRVEGTNDIDEGNIGNFNRYGIWDYMKKLKAEGLIRHYGFSFHSTPEHLDQLLTDHPDVEFVQLQINYADWEDPLICSSR